MDKEIQKSIEAKTKIITVISAKLSESRRFAQSLLEAGDFHGYKLEIQNVRTYAQQIESFTDSIETLLNRPVCEVDEGF